jgi:DNA invertase Pin-like site-specific DNA recombinase
MLVGYARVSTIDQKLDLKMDALQQAGCERIFTAQTSGAPSDRPGLQQALDYVRGGDVLVVWRLDRFGRSLKDQVSCLAALGERGVGFRSLQESIDTTTSTGRLVFSTFGALAEFERDLIRERTIAGLEAARARGRRGGRKKALNARKIALASRLKADPSVDVATVCEAVGCSKATLYRYVGPGGEHRITI